jgi:hypothetical protein
MKKSEREDENPESELEQFVVDFSKYGREYQEKYKRLVNKIDVLLESPQTKSRLVPYMMQKKA